MLANLHSYVEIVVKYILVFKTTSNEQPKDYMIFEDLKDTGIKCFLETCSLIKSEETPCTTSESDVNPAIKKFKRNHDDINYSTVYISKSFHERNIRNKSYETVMMEDRDTKFRVIEVPFSKNMFEKIYQLKKEKNIEFTDEEIGLIFYYLFPYKELIRNITYVICYNLQNNPKLVDRLFDIVSNPGIEHDKKMVHLSTIITGENVHGRNFRQAANSHVRFYLGDKECTYIAANKNRVCQDASYYKIELEKLNIAFLIEELNMPFAFLASNYDVIIKKFSSISVSSSLTLKIDNIDYDISAIKSNLVSETQILKHKLALISDNEFFKSDRIREIILVFVKVQIPLEQKIYDDISKLSMVICKSTSYDFFESIPEKIKKLGVVPTRKQMSAIIKSPRNIEKISLDEIKFKENISFPDHMRLIKIRSSKICLGVTITFGQNCTKIIIDNTEGTINFKEFAGVNFVLLKIEEYTLQKNLSFQKKNEFTGSFLKLFFIRVDGKLRLNDNFQKVDFDSVNVAPGSEISLCDQNTIIDITKSSGLFDLTPLIGTSLCFTDEMQFKTTSIEGSPKNFLNLSMKFIKSSTDVLLADCFEKVELSYTTMNDNTRVVLNDNCKTLIIECFDGIIDVSNKITWFDEIKISFPVDRQINISFIGSINTHHLCLNNACKEHETIVSMLSNFEGISHLKFTGKFTLAWNRTAPEYIRTLCMISQNTTKKVYYISMIREKRLPNHISSESLFYETSNVIATYILERALKESVLKMIQNVEFLSVEYNGNYEIFGRMESLQVLDFGTTNFENALFEHLPHNIKLLNISGPNNSEKSGIFKYKLSDLMKLIHCDNLKVLVIDANFIFQVGTLSFVPSSVKILKVHCKSKPKEIMLLDHQKIDLCELYIYNEKLGSNTHFIIRKDIDTQVCVEALQKYIKFESLEQLALVSSAGMAEIDINSLISLNILRKRIRSVFDVFNRYNSANFALFN
ncbi:putative LRR containing protein [Trachipleistophora hominis]|uniref:Putative LRR containing protein n=1 Tax=Trachipleistophora hominis TaxID=72359 RepID=L7JZZ0_TRAHO|nr:putative LRR containing protein [Trachipleistophora hominis]